MMQDRVFQLMQLLQHDVTGDFSTSLTNQFIEIDVVLNDSSISGYEYMGFNVKWMTQDVHQGQFTITTENPIPLMPYSDRFTWAKYGHFILYSGLIPVQRTHPLFSLDSTAACQLACPALIVLLSLPSAPAGIGPVRPQYTVACQESGKDTHVYPTRAELYCRTPQHHLHCYKAEAELPYVFLY